MKSTVRLLLGGVLALACASAAQAQSTTDLTKLSLDDLLSSEVTSVAKRPQRVDEAAAAVFVITKEDIRRSGVSTVAEALRMAPGIEVASLPDGGFAVSARGFNAMAANKLLVLIDGRETYFTIFGGVLWDQNLTPVEDVERIEVVRGPGATLWGANAVNGVVNIVTKHSVDTLGALATVQGDSTGGYRAFARYGFQLGPTATVRAYVAERGAFEDAGDRGGGLHDDFRTLTGGVRLDAQPTDKDALTLQGEEYRGRSELKLADPSTQLALGPFGAFETLPLNETAFGYDVLGRWTRTWDDKTGFSLQAYWDHTYRDIMISGYENHLGVDLSDHFGLGDRNAVLWGATFQQVDDAATAQPTIRLEPAKQTDHIYSVFVQDDVTLVRDRLNLSIGAKIEHNDLSGLETEPSIRAIWRDPAGWSVWAAASRAVRTPTPFEKNFELESAELALVGNPGVLSSEKLNAYELGWRQKIRPGVALDLTGYYHQYDDLISWAFAGFNSGGVAQVESGNRGHAHEAGVEMALDAALTPNWSVKIAGDLKRLELVSGGITALGALDGNDPGASPDGQFSLRSLWTPIDSVDLDLWYRHVAKLTSGSVPAYDDLSLHLAWRVTANIEFSLVGENLLRSQRIEFSSLSEVAPAIVSRRVLFRIAVRR